MPDWERGNRQPPGRDQYTPLVEHLRFEGAEEDELKELLLGIRPRVPAPLDDIFNIARNHLTRVAWHPVRPFNIRAAVSSNCLTFTLANTPFRIALPENVDEIIDEVIDIDEAIAPSNASREERVQHYRAKLAHEDFATTTSPSQRSDACAVFNAIRATADFNAARARALKSFLSDYAKFGYNGKYVGVTDIHYNPIAVEGFAGTEYRIGLQRGDFYSYRVIAEMADRIRNTYSLGDKITSNDELQAYFKRDFQRHIHLSLGISCIIRTLNDDRLILTVRSGDTLNELDEAGKLHCSINEGVKEEHLNPDLQKFDGKFDGEQLVQLVLGAMGEELIGTEHESKKLYDLIEEMYFTGFWVYWPNLSLNCCFYIPIRCTLTDIKNATARAPNFPLESEKIYHDLPRGNRRAVREYIERSIARGQDYHDVWDESGLMTLILASGAMR